MSKTIREVIGEEREKVSVNSPQSTRSVIELMIEEKVGAVAVCDDDKVVGIFTERDVLRRVVGEGLDMDTVSVSKVMTSPVFWIAMDERYEVAKAIMVDKGLGHLVVKDNQQQFRGFVSSRELLGADLADSPERVGKLNDDYYEHHLQP